MKWGPSYEWIVQAARCEDDWIWLPFQSSNRNTRCEAMSQIIRESTYI